jgi:isopenicillin N synthase-like dioxygenase
MSISVLDASQFLHGSPSQRAEFADKLLKSCIEHGFVKLINHGMPDAVITEMFSWVTLVRLRSQSIRMLILWV